jgi:hypothetical protein
LIALALALAAAGAGCSAIVDPDVGKLGPAPAPACTPNRVLSCICRGGLTGTQICNDGGSYDPCVCTGAGQAGMGGKGKN